MKRTFQRLLVAGLAGTFVMAAMYLLADSVSKARLRITPAANKLTVRLELECDTNGATYLIQSTTNLIQWRTILAVNSRPGQTVPLGEFPATGERVLYRALAAPPIADTNPPAWSNGVGGSFSVSPPASVLAQWQEASDDVGVAQYRLYLNGVLITNVLGSVLSYQFTIDPHQRTELRIQALDAADNVTDLLLLAYLPGDKLLAAGDDNGRIYTFYVQTNGTFSAARQIADFGGIARGPAFADFDRDGLLDLMAGYAAGDTLSPQFFKGKGDGSFAAPVPLATFPGAGSYFMDAAAGDFDADGNPDFICGGNSSFLCLYWGKGDGTFTAERRDLGGSSRGMSAGDFNEDGRDDFIRGQCCDGRVRLFLSNGDRTFTEPAQVGDAGDDPYGVAAGDFDEDGHLDVIANQGGNGDVTYFKGFGNGTFTNLGVNGVRAHLDPDNYASMDTADYDGDGHLDLVLDNYSGRSVFFWAGNGDGTFNTNRVALASNLGNALGLAAPRPPPPVDVNISPTDPVTNLNGTIQYTAIGTGVTAGDFFRWSFGDTATNTLAWTFGAGTNNDGRSIAHPYTNEGRFLTRLWHTDAQGINSVRGTYATVRASPPVAQPGGPYVLGENAATQAVWYAALDGSASTDDFGIASYVWSFGDGSSLTNGARVSHTWNTGGVWTVGLKVIDASGQSGSNSTTVTFVPGAPPVAAINGPDLLDEISATNGSWYATFHGTNSSDDVRIWKYDWNFGNGKTGSGATAATTFTAPGMYAVTLVVTDHAGQTNRTTREVQVKANALPVPVIGGSRFLPEDVATNGLWFGAFNGLASTDDQGIYRYDWIYGDGASGSGAQVTHQYGGAGVYRLVLTVTDFGNQTASVTQNVIVVTGELPVARISASPLAPEGAQPVQLSAAASTDDHGIYLYRWLLPPRQFDFAGRFIDLNQWRVAGAAQHEKLFVTGQNNWGATYFFSSATTLRRGTAIEGRVDTPTTNPSHAVVGLKNLNYGSGNRTQFPYAIYFANGAIEIFENGSSRGSPTNYTRGESYDFRIETKPGTGARYYLRSSGIGAPFVKIFESSNLGDTAFSFGADVHSGTWGFDALAVSEVYSVQKELSTPVFPGGTVYLEVVDHALQTNTTSVLITPVIGGPPQAVISGPTNGQAGVEIPFDGYNSADDYAIASYAWDFGDGSPAEFGPAVSHRYNTAGTYTNTLTVHDYAGLSSSTSLVINIGGSNALVCVPWRIIVGIEQPHEVYSGKTNTLKAVARGVPVPFTFIWDYGDGTGSVTNEITTAVASGIYNLEARHAYIGSDGTPYYAIATVLLTNGTVLSDTYPLIIRPRTLDTEMNVAIDEGLWYEHKTQNRYNLDANNKGGDWTSVGYKINATASAVLAFAINGHLITDDASQDPYVETVQRGVNYLLSALETANIGPQTYGDPDGNQNGIGLTGDTSRPIYETGPVMDAFVAAARPELVATAGRANVKGRAFRDIMQDMVDMYCWGQYDHPGVGGGWRYGWNEHPDNSASQWAAIGMYAAEHFWGIPVPEWVKERNKVWLAYSQRASGFGYTGQDSAGFGPGGVEATTPSALVQIAFVGLPTTNALWVAGENYLASNWSGILGVNNVYAHYAIAKAMRTALPQPVHVLAASGKDWFLDPTDGLARWTIDRQRADGSWVDSGRWVDVNLVTPWNIAILSSSLFQRGPVAVITFKPNPSAVGYPIIFDGRASYHQHPAYKVVEYRWDFNTANGVDFEHPDAIGPVVTNAYGALSTNLVSLQVRDNATPQLNDSASVIVRTTIPPFPPSADAGGPYVAAVGEAIKLDGSGSFDVDEAHGDFVRAWDWEIDFAVPIDFNDGITGRVATIVGGFPTAGQRSLGLRVKDATSIVFPQVGSPDLVGEDFTTLYVYDRVTELQVRPKGNKVQLTWTKAGDYAVIQRGTLGPNRGFEEIGRTSSDYSTFLDTNVQYNVEYYYRIFAYQNGRADPLGTSDPKFVVSRQRGFEDHPPHFNSTPLRIAVVGQPYGATLDATDPENDPITFNLLSGPTNMTVNATNGVVDFTPTQEQIGSHFLSFDATNAAGRDVVSFTIFVFPASNNVPVANANGPYAALIGEDIQFSAAGTGDADGDPLRITWSFGDGNVSTNLNPTHAYGAEGDYLVTLFVNDGFGGTASSRTHAEIARPNRAPTASIAGGPQFNLRLGETLTLDGSASFDLDGNPLTFTWIWGDGTTNTGAAAKLSHVYSATGDYTGQLVVSDNRGGQSAYDFDATVASPNQSPDVRFNLPTNSPSVLETITFDASATSDPEGDPLTFEWDFGDRFKTTGPLVTHAYAEIGDFMATLKVSDGRGGATVVTQLVHVLNALPFITSNPPLLVRAGSNYSYMPVVHDTPGEPHSFQLVQGPAGMTINTNNGTLDWLPNLNDVGPHLVVVQATDNHGGFASQAFTLVVTTPTGPEIDLEPTAILMTNVTVDSQSLALGGTLHVRWRNNGADAVPVPYTVSVFVDADGDGAYSTNADRVVGGAYAQAGLSQGFTAFADITLGGQTLFNGAQLSVFVDSQNAVPEYNEANNLKRSGFDVNTNNPPVLDVSASRLQLDRTGLPDSASLTARLGNSGFVSGPAGVSVAFYLGDPASGGNLLAVTQSSTNLVPGRYEDVSVTWSNPPIARHMIFVVADDDGTGTGAYAEISEANNKFSAEADLTINDPPVADAGPDQTIALGEAAALNGRASRDPEGRPLTYRWSFVSIPIGSHPQLGGADTVQPSLQVDAAGDYTVRLIVSDSVNDSPPDEVVISVVDLNANHPPTITSTPQFQGMVNVPYNYAVQASDPDGDTLHFRLQQSVPGMTINTNTGLIQFTPTNAGTFFAQVAVDDGRGASYFQSWSFNTVVFTNLPPQFTTTPITSATPGASYNYDVNATDPNLDNVSFALPQKPAGMTINASSGLISWTPTGVQIGGHPVTVTATDSRGAASSQSFNVVVFTPGASGPVVQPIPDQTRIEPATIAAINLDTYVSDPNHADNQITWTFTGATNLMVTIDANRVARITYTPGTIASERITFLATDPDGNAAYAAPLFSVRAVDNPPVAALANLSDTETTSIETGFFELKGTANDADAIDAVAYRINLFDESGARVADVTPKPVNATGWHEGRVPAGGSLGTLDLTMVRNGGYTLLLEVRGGSRITPATATIALDSQLKIGQVTFAQQDLVLPVRGVGLQVIRTYDSLNPNPADFGYSWCYSVADLGVKFNEQRIQEYDFLDDAYFSLRAGGNRDVTLDMPDTGRRVTFTYSLVQGGFFKLRAIWTPPPGVHATLEPIGSPFQVVLFSLRYWEAAGIETPLEAYDFPGFILTTQDGTKYQIQREDLGYHLFAGSTISEGFVQAYGKAFLTRISEPGGDRTEFVRQGTTLQNIEQYDNGNQKLKSILFQRDAQRRIQAVFTPENLDTNGAPVGPASVTYEYDSAGNLAKVNKLTDAAQPGNPLYATTTYYYGHPRFPHLLTEIKDHRGVSILRSEFDPDGRLVATLDAYGNRTDIRRDLGARTETVFDRMGNPTELAYDERGNVVASTDPLGNTTRFTFDGANRQTSKTDPLGNTTRMEYDTDGNMVSRTDPLGDTSTFAHNASGKQTRVTDPLGHTTTNYYDSGNRLLFSVDALGNRTENRYDAQGNQTTAIDELGRESARFTYDANSRPASATSASGLRWGLAYDNRDNVNSLKYRWVNPADTNDFRDLETRATYNQDGQLTRSVGPLGHETATAFDSFGNVVRTTNALGEVTALVWDARGNQIQTRNPDGASTESVYDANGRVVAVVDLHQPGQAANGTRSVYDAAGRLVRTERLANMVVSISTVINGTNVISSSHFASAGAVLSATESEFDAAGRRIAKTDEAGQTTRYEYDAAGHNTAIVDALGNRTEFEFDAGGRQRLMRDSQGREYHFMYDAVGHRVRTIYPDGRSISTAYDALGQVSARTDLLGQTRNLERDAAGDLTAVVLPQINDPENADALGRPRFEYEYDEYGSRTVLRDAKGRETRFGYNELQQLTMHTLPLGQTAHFTYDAMGRVLRRTDFNGQATEFGYDAAGRVTSKKVFAAGTNAPSIIVTYVYDDVQRTKRVSEARGITEYRYDADGRTVQISSPEGTVNYEYDEATGRKTRTATANSDTRYGYDELGRLKSVIVLKRAGQTLPQPEVTTYSYDAVGNRQSVNLPNGVTTRYEYDENNRLRTLTHFDANSNRLAAYSYLVNGKGLRTAANEIKRSSGTAPFATNAFAFGYDALGRLIAETNRFSQTTQSGFTSQYTYDLVGNRLVRQVTVGNARLTTTYLYDNNDRLLVESNSLASTSQAAPGKSVPVLFRGVTGRAEVLYLPRPSAWWYYGERAIPYALVLAFFLPVAFVPWHRWRKLRVATTDLCPERALVPRCVAGLLVVTMIVTSLDRRLLADEAARYQSLSTGTWGMDGSVTRYEYNDNGSVVHKAVTGPRTEITHYTYDLDNRLATVTMASTNASQTIVATTRYTHNSDGQRVRSENLRTVNGLATAATTNIFLIDPLNHTGFTQVLEELPAVGAVPTRSYTIGDDVLSQTIDEGGQLATDHFLYDGRECTRQLVSQAGVVTGEYAYDAYGMMIGGNPTSSQPARTSLLYAGERFDANLQQYHLRARDYDPSNGRFTGRDLFEGSVDDPQSLHKYAYANADPINHVDPGGEFTLVQIAVTSAIIGILAGIAAYAITGSLKTAIIVGLLFALVTAAIMVAITFWPAIVQAFRAMWQYQLAHRTISNRLFAKMAQELGPNIGSIQARLQFFSQFSRFRLFLEGVVGYGQQLLKLFYAPRAFFAWLAPTPAGLVGLIFAGGVAAWLLWAYKDEIAFLFEDIGEP